VGSEEIERRYLDLANVVQRLYKAVLPDPAAHEFDAEVAPVEVIADKIRALTPRRTSPRSCSRWSRCWTVPSPPRDT